LNKFIGRALILESQKESVATRIKKVEPVVKLA
jgi:hypothetical protein